MLINPNAEEKIERRCRLTQVERDYSLEKEM